MGAHIVSIVSVRLEERWSASLFFASFLRTLCELCRVNSAKNAKNTEAQSYLITRKEKDCLLLLGPDC